MYLSVQRRARRAHPLTAATLALAAVLTATVPALAAATKVIHAFSGPDGAQPMAALIQATDGYFYGTTPFGGAMYGTPQTTDGYGTVFRIGATGQVTVLHSFDRCDPAGYEPRGALIQASDGFFYGTTARGGKGNACGRSLDTRRGTVFRMDRDGNITTIHTFNDYHDGDAPWAGLVEGPDGALYGTTRVGGDIQQAWPLGRGTVFKVTKGGDFTVLRRFTGPDGVNPIAPLARAANGRLYGTTNMMRSVNGSGGGTIFQITPSTGAFKLLHVFGQFEGAGPRGRLVQHPADGYLYGVTVAGGYGGALAGVIYRIHPSGAPFEVIVHLGRDGGYQSTGTRPQDGLTLVDDGSFYGTTQFGGQPIDGDREGTVFRVRRNGRFGIVHTFAGGPEGLQPATALVQGSNGKLYGMAYGGEHSRGIVYRYAPDARAVLLGVGVKPRELWAGDPAFGIATGTVILDGRAPAGGAVVGLTSSQPGLVQVPQTVTVAPGWSTADFSVTSSSSDEEQTVTITAMFGGVSRSVTIAVHPSF
ncbi:MAG: hypothetical protein H0W07_07745 [Chloroflexi bacterium]|nr:hypothetical protein [Chloroflexota bacterium]